MIVRIFAGFAFGAVFPLLWYLCRLYREVGQLRSELKSLKFGLSVFLLQFRRCRNEEA